MNTLTKRLNTVEIRINTLRLEIVALQDELNRMIGQNPERLEDIYVPLKVKFLAKKFELAKMKSERRLLELQALGSRAAA